MPVRSRRKRIHRTKPAGLFRLNKHSPQARGLVGWWPLYGNWINQSNVAIDLSGNGFHLPECPDGETSDYPGNIRNARGQVATFDGSEAWGNHDNTPVRFNLNYDDEFSFSGWFNSLNPGQSDGTKIIEQNRRSSSHIITLQFSPDGSLQFITRNFSGTFRIASAAADYGDGNWHLIVGSYYNSAPHIFIDGVLIDTGSAQTEGTIAVANSDLHIGTSENHGARYMPSGSMLYDVRYYHRGLRASEVYQLYAPSTRYDLYEPVSRVWAVIPSEAPPDYPIPEALHTYRQRRL